MQLIPCNTPPPDGEALSREYRELLGDIDRAFKEWKRAESFLDLAEDPEMVECAVFGAEAARRRYLYILGKLRRLRMSMPRE